MACVAVTFKVGQYRKGVAPSGQKCEAKSHLGLLLAHVEGDGVDEGLGVHLVVVHGATVPDLVGRTVVDVREVAVISRNFNQKVSNFYIFGPIFLTSKKYFTGTSIN